MLASHSNVKDRDKYSDQYGMCSGQYGDLSFVVGFVNQNYCLRSVATQIYYYVGCALIPYILKFPP